MKRANFARFEGEERWKEGKLGMGAGARATKRDEMGMGMATLFLRIGSYEQQSIVISQVAGKEREKNGADIKGIRYQEGTSEMRRQEKKRKKGADRQWS
jgi:L-aminopeptidase/D-esterase-like protein